MRRLAITLFVFCSVISTARAADRLPTLTIFFQEWSAAFDDAAKEIVAGAAKAAQANPRTMVVVTGFADPTGSKQANVLLSELRAQRVVDDLVTAGVSPSRLSQIGRGSVKFAYSAQESRRVQISFVTR